MTITTPSGTLRVTSSRPFGRVIPLVTSPIGSGSAAISRTAEAIEKILFSFKSKRSINAEESFFSFPSFRSNSLAKSISALRFSNRSAKLKRTLFFLEEESCFRTFEAFLAREHKSCTYSISFINYFLRFRFYFYG
ncbi:hypothetical protein LIF_A0700 [Leptospira interrogans serovar Lai str. IPAV]|uniref:Uncharacterized protein n=1 Tax=Leptospira interrogans serogroup Icterohaemorrhagiae serovar Lai (strain 56601) TaxID=189518 RepID=D4YW23_LEPIN|nr:hypothetical protein LA_0853a [Leptospira interrogans serovar Lai str. 56601]AER01508.1 hypothetical protein LIF_A0700 [Leptospira interrogans serovar Lai str. IPAV]